MYAHKVTLRLSESVVGCFLSDSKHWRFHGILFQVVSADFLMPMRSRKNEYVDLHHNQKSNVKVWSFIFFVVLADM